jgi:16S rRNA (guanine966-N2)-methyltransferase
VKEALFSLIGQDVSDQRVLDLFAGSGSLGIEALSRGAVWSLFIDNSLGCINLIKKNLELCGYKDSGTVLMKDLSRGFPWKHPLMRGNFDLIFIDPPYGKGLIPPILGELSHLECVLPTSIVLAESSKKDALPSEVGYLRLIDSRIYGETKIDIYRKWRN